MLTKEQFLVEVWQRMGKEIAAAADLELIQNALADRFGTAASMSPAAIARVLADHGVQLGHPQILAADSRWRERNALFTTEDLTLATLEGATALIDKIERLRRQFEHETAQFERLRKSVQQLKTELQFFAPTDKATQKSRDLAREVAQWLTIWLENPQLFADWLVLRRATAEFQELFGTFPPA